MTDFLETAKDAVRAHGTAIKQAFDAHAHTVTRKADKSLVTELDLSAERAMRALISERHPAHDILGEEFGQSAGTDAATEYQWVLDPIDGTNNYIRGIPMFLAAAGLLHRGELIVGALYQPLTDELWWASRGEGAYLNGQRLQLTAPARLKDAVVSYTHTNQQCEQFMQALTALEPHIRAPRIFGSGLYSVAQLASGRVDVHVGVSPYVWDIAPGIVIAHEAGAVTVDFSGQPWQPGSQEFMMAHPAMVPELTRLLSK